MFCLFCRLQVSLTKANAMKPAVLVINAGSSSIKFALFNALNQSIGERLYHGLLEGIGVNPKLKIKNGEDATLADIELAVTAKHADGLMALLDWLNTNTQGIDIIGIGHRVLHGGKLYSTSQKITPEVMAYLEALIPLGPLHQPHNLNPIRVLTQLKPTVPQIAVFDTAYHRTQPEVAERFAIPKELHDEGVKRYGFHGISYAYIAEQLPEVLGEKANGRVVVCHLGNGASLCAIKERKSIATTMGFTPLDGLMMGTRCGLIDGGVIFYLLQQKGMSVDEVNKTLNHKSGLLGVSGISSDIRDLEASNSPDATEALELFVYRAVREIGSMVAALGGLDAIIFTAGIGENAIKIRAAICEKLTWLGLDIDLDANNCRGKRIKFSTADSKIEAWVVPTNEEVMIAEDVLSILGK